MLAPGSARAAIREMFLRHVIGGKHLSTRADFTAMVRGATPDVVLTAVELLARGLDAEHPGAGDVVVVDVGGATTDVHSVVEVDAEDAGLAREVVATLPVSRTVEGDLGMRWSAVPTVEEGVAAGLLDGRPSGCARPPRRRHADPAFLPADPDEAYDDEQVATAAVGVALRRHAGRQQVVYGRRRPGRRAQRQGPARGRPARRVRRRAAQRPRRLAARVLGSVTGEPRRRRLAAAAAPRARSSTATTCWRPPACSRTTHPRAAHALLARLRPAPSAPGHSLGP